MATTTTGQCEDKEEREEAAESDEEAEEDEDLPETSGDEEDDGEAENQLIQAIALLGKRQYTRQWNEPSSIISEFNISTDQQKSIDTSELLQGLTNKKGLKQLKQRLNKLSDNTTQLLKPLAPIQKDRIHRKLAYEKSSKQISDWDPIVKHNKRADHLQFPLQEDVPAIPSLNTKVESFKAVTPLEQKVQFQRHCQQVFGIAMLS
ncbi:PREDICTED: U3 small nucleolar RNA-associated protein 14 homolog A-like [Amphimedon queenslandica]|uniref:Uncharacterized protein n=1 Tax=Amphimedon queenslandica TaxID=400682 RepID=A0A1X7SUX4_AMPQE|nr:PREDICTED: U3 small nucleolar RNA-associated protein 14 homolog A-like [Amphimedon queenslandica]|eukprot:XP_019862643.1 PREDICTED: U3 small nucleolar RNA-associated protein 14 homolog A-like [Amphimedon queenslandica]